MNGQPDLWRTEPDGALAAEADGFRLVVPLPKQVGEQAHFLISHRQGHRELHSLVRSGTEESVHAAMKAAERIVERLLERPFGGRGAPYFE